MCWCVIDTYSNSCHKGAQAFSHAFFGRGSGPILMAYVGCTGLETHLANCTHSPPNSCSHYEDAGVRCQGIRILTSIYIGHDDDCGSECLVWFDFVGKALHV